MQHLHSTIFILKLEKDNKRKVGFDTFTFYYIYIKTKKRFIET